MSSPSRPDNYLSLRRADDGSVNSAVVCSLRYSSSSGRPAAPASPSLEGYTKRKACCAVVGRAVSHPQNAYSAHLRGQYQQPHPVGKALTLLYKSHLSYNSSSPFKGGVRRTGDLATTDQAAAVMVFAEGSSNLASPMLCGNAASQGARPRSCGRTLCLSTTPPSPARRPASPFSLPWARSVCTTSFVSTIARKNVGTFP